MYFKKLNCSDKYTTKKHCFKQQDNKPHKKHYLKQSENKIITKEISIKKYPYIKIEYGTFIIDI